MYAKLLKIFKIFHCCVYLSNYISYLFYYFYNICIFTYSMLYIIYFNGACYSLENILYIIYFIQLYIFLNKNQ